MKPTVTNSVAESMKAATQGALGDGHQLPDQLWVTAALAARATLGDKLTEYADALVAACVRQGHPGAEPKTEQRQGIPCRKCRPKVRHVRECAGIVLPDSE